jgi:hypothetical protein
MPLSIKPPFRTGAAPRVHPTPSPRLFFYTYTPRQHLLSPPGPRPQLPFLNAGPASSAISRHRSPLLTRLARLPLTTERRALLQRQARDTFRAASIVVPLLSLAVGCGWLLAHELLEREHPTPPQWSARSRVAAHAARAAADGDATPSGSPEWAFVERAWCALLARLEDREGDGRRLRVAGRREIGDLGKLVSEFDLETCFDISDMSEPWRRGYVEAMMGAAKTAAALEGFVYDSRSGIVLPAKYVITAMNPKPPRLPPWINAKQPLQENCTRVVAPAGLFYEKILGTVGLEVRQGVDARIEYAELLRRKGRVDDAERLIREALAMAVEAAGGEGKRIVDLKTGVIRKTAPFVTQNILDATTALGVNAAARDPREALPIFLSVLRAYRPGPSSSLTASSAPSEQQDAPPAAQSTRELLGDMHTQVITDLQYRITSLFTLAEFPPPPPSGNEALRPAAPGADALRQRDCAEAAAATYAAEVLFATTTAAAAEPTASVRAKSKASAERGAALGWTRKAVEDAHARAADARVPAAERKRCLDCAFAALLNWEAMVERLRRDEGGRVGEKFDGESEGWKVESAQFLAAAKKLERDDIAARIEFSRWKLWTYVAMGKMLMQFI